MRIVIELAGEPVGKGRARFVRSTGRAFTPQHTRRYESHLRLAAQEAMACRPLLDGPLEMTIRVFIPIPASWSGKQRDLARRGLRMPTGRPDYDNYGKLASDALNAVVFRDDAQVVDCFISKRYSDRPALVIEIDAAKAIGRDMPESTA
jgi:Holliday junction resolvase RusA-like endonuclease